MGAADAGAAPLLRRFEQWRAHDRSGVVHFTDSLVKLFAEFAPGGGLAAQSRFAYVRSGSPARVPGACECGFGGPAPRLARGLAVRHVTWRSWAVGR